MNSFFILTKLTLLADKLDIKGFDRTADLVDNLIKSSMAITDFQAGQPIEGSSNYSGGQYTTYDYSHFLTPEQRNDGYMIKIRDYTAPPETHPKYYLTLEYNGKVIGDMNGLIIDGKLEPHSSIKKEYRGAGFGKKMYEALYTHALRIGGINKIRGGRHSIDAGRVHTSLTQTHQLPGYKPKLAPYSEGEKPLSEYEYDLESRPDFEMKEKDKWLMDKKKVERRLKSRK